MKTVIPLKFAAATIVIFLLAGGAAFADDATPMWDSSCAACHGKDGAGKTMMGGKLNIKDLTDPKVQAALTDAAAAKTIKEGFTDANGMLKMKAFGDKFSDDDIKALVAQIRTFKSAK